MTDLWPSDDLWPSLLDVLSQRWEYFAVAFVVVRPGYRLGVIFDPGVRMVHGLNVTKDFIPELK